MSDLTPERREALEQMPYVAALQGVEPETLWRLLDAFAELNGKQGGSEIIVTRHVYDGWLDCVTRPTPLPDAVKARLYDRYCRGTGQPQSALHHSTT